MIDCLNVDGKLEALKTWMKSLGEEELDQLVAIIQEHFLTKENISFSKTMYQSLVTLGLFDQLFIAICGVFHLENRR